MNFRAMIVLLAFAPAILRAETEISAPETDIERQGSTSEQEWEAKDIIPDGGLTVSTQPMTPITLVPEKKPMDQALQELAIAQDLWKNGKAQAASDVALQAYDDLMSMRLARRNKKQRQKLRQDRRTAATVYTDASITYITEYVKKNGGGPKAIDEGHARLGDLRDVAQNYPELNKKLNAVLDVYTVKVSTPPGAAPVAATSTTTPVPVSAPASTPTVVGSTVTKP